MTSPEEICDFPVDELCPCPVHCKTEERSKSLVTKDRYYRRTYGIGLRQYAELLKLQGFRCAICPKGGLWLDVDHDHKSATVRGLLCRYCNHRVVGRHRDGDLLIKAGTYLNNPPALSVLGAVASVPPKRKRKRRPQKRNPKLR